MWIVITIALLLIILFLFIKDTGGQAIQVNKEGGMRNKYSELINILLSEDPRSQIFKETSISITLGLSNSGGTSLYILTQTYGELNVQWKVESPVFGKHELEWEFPEYSNQSKMAQRIANDTAKYQQNVMNARGLSGPLD